MPERRMLFRYPMESHFTTILYGSRALTEIPLEPLNSAMLYTRHTPINQLAVLHRLVLRNNMLRVT